MKLDNLLKLVSTGLAICIAFVSVIAWLTTIQVNGRQNSESIEAVISKIDAVAEDTNATKEDVYKIKTDIALIKQALGVGRVSVSDFNALK